MNIVGTNFTPRFIGISNVLDMGKQNCNTESKALPKLRWLVVGLSTRKPSFVPGSFHARCAVDKVVL